MRRARRLAFPARSLIFSSCRRRQYTRRAAMADEFVIVSGADSGYFPLLRDLVLSIRDKAPGEAAAIGVFDLGLTAEQRSWLGTQHAAEGEPGWDVDFPPRKRTPPLRNAPIARPLLPRHFPRY